MSDWELLIPGRQVERSEDLYELTDIFERWLMRRYPDMSISDIMFNTASLIAEGYFEFGPTHARKDVTLFPGEAADD